LSSQPHYVSISGRCSQQPTANIAVSGRVQVPQPVARKTNQKIDKNLRNKSQKWDTKS